VIEMNVGILCASLPSMTPLLHLAMRGRAAKTSASADSYNKATNSGRNRTYWLRKRGDISLMESNASQTWLNETSTRGPKPVLSKPVINRPEIREDVQLQIIENPSAIHVTKDVSWS